MDKPRESIGSGCRTNAGLSRPDRVGRCVFDQRDYQPFPRTGQLAIRTNPPLARVLEGITSSDLDRAMVYCYVVATVEQRQGRFVQLGSGPNFQGGAISLCTCKHALRTFRDLADWPGIWIAGFTGVRAGQGRNALVYLMRVGQAFASHADLWDARTIPAHVKRAKAADANPFGDVFRPVSEGGSPFKPRNYAAPHPRHCHRSGNAWHGDIDYVGRGGRRAALLVGDPQASYLWDRPMLYLPSRLHRGQSLHELNALLAQLGAGCATVDRDDRGELSPPEATGQDCAPDLRSSGAAGRAVSAPHRQDG